MFDDLANDLETVEDLTRPEHLVVWAMRVIALGHEDCPAIVRTFRHICGDYGDQTLQTCVIFVKYLAMTSNRRLQVHSPGCTGLGADEAAALAIVATGQRSLHTRDEAEVRMALNELTGRSDESLVLVAQAFARLLEACRLTLPHRAVEPVLPWREASTAIAQLH